MELNSDIWSKITEFLASETEREAKRKNIDVWTEYGRLFKDLRRISKKARRGVIAQQRELLKIWFKANNMRLTNVHYRKYTYKRILDITIFHVKYPNGTNCPHRYCIAYDIKKYGRQCVRSIFTVGVRFAEVEKQYQDIKSKLFSNIVDTSFAASMDVTSEIMDTSTLDRALSYDPIMQYFVDTPNEIYVSLRFRNGKRHGPSIIHFPKKDIMYVFIYEHDTLVVSAKKMSGRFRFHVHETSKDPLIQSYVQALQSSLFTNVTSV